MTRSVPPCSKFPTHQQLLDALLNQIEAAYACLVSICEREIIPAILQANPKLSNWEAKEKVFDALAALIELLRAQRVKDSAKTLLWQIAKNKIVDLIRKKVTSDQEGNVIVRTASLDGLADFEELFVATDAFSPIKTQPYRDVLASLTDTEKRILDLSTANINEAGELDDQQIADTLGLALRTVQNAKAEIRKKLKRNFRQDAY